MIHCPRRGGVDGIMGLQEKHVVCAPHTWASPLSYSAEDYHHFYGSHDARWQCLHECPRKCESDWHHGRYFGCYDESHLMAMDRMYGHRDGYTVYYGHFGDLC